MTKRRKKPLKKGRSTARSVPPFPYEFRLKVARLYLEDGYPAKLIASQFGISDYSVYTWAKRYREQGEQGLVDKSKAATGSKLPEAVSQSIVDLKKENPGYGARRISDILKRFFWLRTSASTVQRTLRDQGLTQTPKRKRFHGIIKDFVGDKIAGLVSENSTTFAGDIKNQVFFKLLVFHQHHPPHNNFPLDGAEQANGLVQAMDRV